MEPKEITRIALEKIPNLPPKNREINQLIAAFMNAQSEMKQAAKNAENPEYKSKYANFSEIVNAVREPLRKHGLTIMQNTFYQDVYGNKKLMLRTTLHHLSGQSIFSDIEVPFGNNIQTFGSNLSYLKRYQYVLITGVPIADGDDDGNASAKVRQNETTIIEKNNQENIEKTRNIIKKTNPQAPRCNM